MNHGEDEPYGAGDPTLTSGPPPPLRAAALAAEMLQEAWAGVSGDALRAEVVRDLVGALREEIEALAGLAGGTEPADALVDGALQAADVANLAASSLAELPTKATAAEAAGAAHLAAGATHALIALAEVSCAVTLDGEHAEHALKDARSARWRASFAVRQTNEYAGIEG